MQKNLIMFIHNLKNDANLIEVLDPVKDSFDKQKNNILVEIQEAQKFYDEVSNDQKYKLGQHYGNSFYRAKHKLQENKNNFEKIQADVQKLITSNLSNGLNEQIKLENDLVKSAKEIEVINESAPLKFYDFNLFTKYKKICEKRLNENIDKKIEEFNNNENVNQILKNKLLYLKELKVENEEYLNAFKKLFSQQIEDFKNISYDPEVNKMLTVFNPTDAFNKLKTEIDNVQPSKTNEEFYKNNMSIVKGINSYLSISRLKNIQGSFKRIANEFKQKILEWKQKELIGKETAFPIIFNDETKSNSLISDFENFVEFTFETAEKQNSTQEYVTNLKSYIGIYNLYMSSFDKIRNWMKLSSTKKFEKVYNLNKNEVKIDRFEDIKNLGNSVENMLTDDSLYNNLKFLKNIDAAEIDLKDFWNNLNSSFSYFEDFLVKCNVINSKHIDFENYVNFANEKIEFYFNRMLKKVGEKNFKLFRQLKVKFDKKVFFYHENMSLFFLDENLKNSEQLNEQKTKIENNLETFIVHLENMLETIYSKFVNLFEKIENQKSNTNFLSNDLSRLKYELKSQAFSNLIKLDEEFILEANKTTFFNSTLEKTNIPTVTYKNVNNLEDFVAKYIYIYSEKFDFDKVLNKGLKWYYVNSPAFREESPRWEDERAGYESDYGFVESGIVRMSEMNKEKLFEFKNVENWTSDEIKNQLGLSRTVRSSKNYRWYDGGRMTFNYSFGDYEKVKYYSDINSFYNVKTEFYNVPNVSMEEFDYKI